MASEPDQEEQNEVSEPTEQTEGETEATEPTEEQETERVGASISATSSAVSEAEGKEDAGPADGAAGVDEVVPVEKHDSILIMTDSMKEINDQIEPPLTAESKENIQVMMDEENLILKRAFLSVKENFTETKVLAELRKMYDMFLNSQVENSIIVGKCNKFLDKISKYEARHRQDPRVLQALKMAERHRKDKQDLMKEHTEMESDFIECQMELRMCEDSLKNKIKEYQKSQEEVRKLKDIERQVENLETQLMSKENDYQTLKEQYMTDVENAKSEVRRELEATIKRLHEEVEAMSALSDKDKKIYDLERHRQQLFDEIDAMRSDKQKMEHNKVKLLKDLTCSKDKTRHLTSELAVMEMKNARLHEEKMQVEKEKVKWQMKCEIVHRDLDRFKDELMGCRTSSHTIKQTAKEARSLNLHLKAANKRLDDQLQHASSCLSICKMETERLLNDVHNRDDILAKTSTSLKSKVEETENLAERLNTEIGKRSELSQLLRASEANALTLSKEITNIRSEMANFIRMQKEFITEKNALRIKAAVIKNQYLEEVKKNLILFGEKEQQKYFANQMEQYVADREKHLMRVVSTNIELYCDNITNQEIAALQNMQIKNKTKEVEALESMNDDLNLTVARLDVNLREKTNTIEALSHDVGKYTVELKDVKVKVKTLTDEVERLKCELYRAGEVEKQLLIQLHEFRRQRDLFGTRLIQSRTEVDLMLKKKEIEDKANSQAAVVHRNLQNDMAILKLEIRNLRGKLKQEASNQVFIKTLRGDMTKLATKFELEKIKKAALEKEKMPQIHHLRTLQAREPSKFELVLKLNHVTKRLIDKTTEVANMEQIIEQKDYRFMELRTLLVRHANPNLQAEISLARSVIGKQENRLKALKAELVMADHDLCNKDQKLQAQHKEVLQAKKKVTQQQRVNRRLKDQAKVKLPPIVRPQQGRKFCGSGFVLKSLPTIC